MNVYIVANNNEVICKIKCASENENPNAPEFAKIIFIVSLSILLLNYFKILL